MSDREVFIIEDTETKLIDGYYLSNTMALQAAVRYAERTGHSMEVKLMENIEWMDKQITEDGKLIHLEDDVMIKCSEEYLNEGRLRAFYALRLQARVRDNLG
tara:strand:- start:63 stop:368 length:306 start_codon:yes stop_codon:yes gene_type:complete